MDAVKERRDEELLADHLAGTAGAFDALVARYADELYGFLFRFVGNAAAADDLTQEAFVQVHLAAGAFDPERRFRPWLYTIAANKARDYLRSHGRRTEQSLDSQGRDGQRPASQLLEADEPRAGESADAEQTRSRVRELIAQMPEHLRLILMLGYYHQMPYAEIAEILDIPVGTVKSRLHAAVTHFAKLWRSTVPAQSRDE
jgi:RNA polymerase sigma-70 factor (ECF subfamily)